ncbi:unnamed protein product [Rhizoctonia solani]|uniref:F-box domain-containing protein n=1 Tax=Rhizoctonia solani TaxID=456999 RepID=A0A8H3CTR2_9AGAM|nr:unnamed protein product [Rhizoctonia solani]
MKSLFIQAPCSVTLDWEDASASLASALTTYLDLSLSLESKYLRVAMTSNLVDRIDSKLGNIQSIMEEQLFKSRSALARTRNRLASPLYRFPEEIMSQIFMNVIHDYHPLMENISPISMEDHLTYTYRSLHDLLRVCSVWRNVALRRAALWSTIPILDSAFGISFSGCRLYQETRLSLQRAGGAGLHLAAVLGISEYQKTKLLPDYASRFHTINLKSEHLRSIQKIIDMVLESGIPRSLRELSICHTHSGTCNYAERLPRNPDYLNLHECNHRATFGQLVQSVATLRISGLPFHWHAITFSTELVELQIHSVTLGYESGLNHFLKAVASATQLRDLKIISVSAFPNPEENESAMPLSIAIPNLESLYLQDLHYNVLQRILTTIVPGSHHLTLYLTHKSFYTGTIDADSEDFTEEDVEPSDLCNLLCIIPVNTLLLFGDYGDHWLTDLELRQLLRSIPSLKTLRMSDWDFFATNWATLERPRGVPFPKLQNLHLTGARIFDAAGLKKVITSHQIQHLEIGGSVYKGEHELANREELKLGGGLVNWLESHVPSVCLRKHSYEAPEFQAARWRLW